MRVQVVAIAVLSSLIMWAASFLILERTYHVGQTHGVIRNFHFRKHFGLN